MPSLRPVLRRAHELDLELFLRLARYESEILDNVLPRLTRAADNSRLWMVLAVLMFASGRRKLRRGALRGLLSVAATSAMVNGPLKWMGRRTRPKLDLVPEARRILKIPVTTSFPSGHTASAFAFATGVAVESRSAGALVYPLAAAVGVSRVYSGAHYPADVLVGGAIGAAAATATGRMWPIPPEGAAEGTGIEIASDALPREDGSGLAIVINRASGGNATSAKARLETLMPEAEIVEVDPEAGGSLSSVLQEVASRAKAIGICGGDGSVNTAAKVAVSNDLPLLVIPGGTLDHFAHALGIDSARAAADAIRGRRILAVDVGWIDEHPFLNTASVGSYVEMIETRERLQRRIGKWPALMVAMLQVLRRSDPVEVELDGTSKKLWLAFFGNCRYHPSGFGPSWRERLDDGMIDLRYVEAGAPLARTRFFAAVLTGRLGRSKVYTQRPVSSVRVAFEGEASGLSRDGEAFDGNKLFEVTKTRRGLKVLVPTE